MIQLYQFAYSPYCIVQRRILEWSGAPFKILNIPNSDRTLIWRITKQRYYQVPVLVDGKKVLFETEENSQVIAKYLDDRLELGLFPEEWEGVQSLLWRYFENEVESFTFRINDTHWRHNVSKADHLGFVRHKERKFGRGCLDLWTSEKPQLLKGLETALGPAENMLKSRPFLLSERPLFVDFNLLGMLGNLLYSGEEAIPESCVRLRDWYRRMDELTPLEPKQKSRRQTSDIGYEFRNTSQRS